MGVAQSADHHVIDRPRINDLDAVDQARQARRARQDEIAA
jgi:hypothetical protein